MTLVSGALPESTALVAVLGLDTGLLGELDTGALGELDTGALRELDTGALGEVDTGALGEEAAVVFVRLANGLGEAGEAAAPVVVPWP